MTRRRFSETRWLGPAGAIHPLLLLLLLLMVAGPSAGCSAGAGGDEDGEVVEASKETSEGAGDEADAAGETEASSGEQKKNSDNDKEPEKPVPVEVAPVRRGDIELFLRASANLEAENQVKVLSQAARLVRELHVEEGDRVRKGDLLVRLQDEEQRSALAKAENEYEKTARRYEQQKKLFEKELISQEDFNNATYEVEQLRISLEDARRELTYTEVRAPIDGTITERHVQVSDHITVGQHLFDLVDFDSIVARIYVPEKELPRLLVGQPAWLTTQGEGEPARPGTVRRISPIVDPQTGTVKVTVALEGRHGLRPGMYVDVKLITDTHRDVLLVPKRALIYDQDQIFVYRLGEERRVVRLLVEPILEDKEFVEPAGGFSLGDRIVVAGQAGLKDDALVRLPGDPDPDDADAVTDENGKGTDGTQVASEE